MVLQTPIIPTRQFFFGKQDTPNLEAICVFAAIGFFLDQDTYFKEEQVLKPGYKYHLNETTGKVESAEPWFEWHSSPAEISLMETVEMFANLFERIIEEQVANNTVILPLSGGLDSRTQAAALKRLGKNVSAYSYSFEGGHDEVAYGKRIAEACGYNFQSWQVPSGYLWNSIENLANINRCYSEFTHPRQMAFVDQYAALGDIFSLGHWGDVLFDTMGVPDNLPFDEQVSTVLKKIVKKGGKELGTELWKAWNLAGNFDEYLTNRVRLLLAAIKIQHSANARIRAFKSLHWAPRWTATNLSIFESVRPISVPYFDDRMCQFICSVPELYLSKRTIQIEYLKMRAPKLAQISWQEHRPFNLYNYHLDKAPYNWPYRAVQKLMRSWNNQKLIQRNWELQFLGAQNDAQLRNYLFNNPAFSEMVPRTLVKKIYDDFWQVNPVYFSHSISMLLTLAMHAKQQSK